MAFKPPRIGLGDVRSIQRNWTLDSFLRSYARAGTQQPRHRYRKAGIAATRNAISHLLPVSVLLAGEGLFAPDG